MKHSANRLITVLTFFTTLVAQAQLSGTVTDEQGEVLPFVNVYVEGSYRGTTTNTDGRYQLDLGADAQVVVFQYLGYTTQKIPLTDAVDNHLNVRLQPESYRLDEVVVSASENPADRIIRNAIDKRKEHAGRMSRYTADFYSRGLWKLKDVPEKILGQEVGDFDGAIDSTRSGIVYLSETISNIAVQPPNRFKEHITASKVSGNDNGFSFNSAQEAEISFYENAVNINVPLVSPIAGSAFGYYRYRLEGSFYESGQLINKIAVMPRRPNDRVFSGYIYIVEDSWQIYGVELQTHGKAIQVPFVEHLQFRQSFSYDEAQSLWVKRLQTIDFSFGIFKMKGDGRFTAVYSNYDFDPLFDRKAFTNEVVYMSPEANQKDSLFWQTTRPVPLTDEETADYVRRDSIQEIRKSKVYLDSIDRKSNRFRLLSPLTGYSNQSTYNRRRFSYSGLLAGVSYNTLQGWNGSADISYRKWKDEHYSQLWEARAGVNYGHADERVRLTGSVAKRFNTYNRRTLSLSAGNKVQQFNRTEPISPRANMVSTLFFERNFMKAYELTYGRVGYSQEITNGINLTAQVGFERRKPLFDKHFHFIIDNKETSFTSNNPLAPDDFDSAAIDEHQLVKAGMQLRFVFGQKFLNYPSGKYNLGNNKFPTLTLSTEGGFASSNSDYHFLHYQLAVRQSPETITWGKLLYNLKAGGFAKGGNISFADYKHFNGNQTRIGKVDYYTEVFNLLPYYELSTNGLYAEGHLEHDFKGFVLGKLPLINRLNFNLVVGAHQLFTETGKPYSELSAGLNNVGIGKFRFFRVDYVRSFHPSTNFGAVVLGLKFMQLL